MYHQHSNTAPATQNQEYVDRRLLVDRASRLLATGVAAAAAAAFDELEELVAASALKVRPWFPSYYCICSRVIPCRSALMPA